MKHRFTPAVIVLLMILSLLLGSSIGGAAPTNRALLPTVYGQPVASTCDGSAPILDRDTGSLSVAYDAGHWFVSYQDRASGGRGRLAEHVGGGLVEVAPPVGPTAPSFSPPDSVKIGSTAIMVGGGERRWYYTSRKIDDTPNEGPYAIWCVGF